MRLLGIFLLIFLLIAGPVAAISASPASGSAAAKAIVTARPVDTFAPKITMFTPVPVITPPPTGMLWLESRPSGAAVTIDGRPAATVTPLLIELSARNYTITVSLEGYQDYTRTVMVPSNGGVNILAELVPVPKIVALKQNIPVIRSVQTPDVINRTIVPTTSATPVLPFPHLPFAYCLPDQLCMTLWEAERNYAPGWWHNETSICGVVVLPPTPAVRPEQYVLKYCTRGERLSTPPAGSSKMTEQQAVSQAIVIAPTGLNAKFVDTSPTITGQPVLPIQTPQVLGAKRQVGVIDSFVGFFTGLFSHLSCPKMQTACGGKCVDTLTDSQNCGSCDYTCFDPAVCISGKCDNPTFPQPPVGDLL